jgi:hypothetical protein
MRLMVEVGTGCAGLANEQMRDLDCRRIQCDEIWSFVKVKQGHIKIGDQWTDGTWALTFRTFESERRTFPIHL